MCCICYAISLCSVLYGKPEDVCVIFVMLFVSVVYYMVSQRICVCVVFVMLFLSVVYYIVSQRICVLY